jgi:nicotinamide mononucleotide (NMN) deamidase PncC
MLFRKFSKFLTAAALAIAFVACAGIAGGSEVKAQGYYCNDYQNRHRQWEREAFRRQQERERFFLLRQRQREREYWRGNERFERSRYYSRFGRYPYYRRW